MMMMMKMCNKVWALFFSWTALQLLWSNMDKAAISAISKIVGPQEIGKILCLVNKSSQRDEKTVKISGSVVESSSHSGWFTVLRLPVPICPRYQFPWALSVRLLLIVCFCFCCFLCYLLSLRCVSVLTFACGGAFATYSRLTMIVTSEEESDQGDKKSSRE